MARDRKPESRQTGATPQENLQQHLTLKIQGVLHRHVHHTDMFLGQRAVQRLRAETGWFEKLVKHSPSVGTFYEDILRALITELLPTGLKAGSGFIFDPETMRTSNQLDILVYEDTSQAPFLRRGEFTVVPPKVIRAVSEVKKTLTKTHITSIIQKTFTSNCGSYQKRLSGCQNLRVFAYKSRVKPERVQQIVRDELDLILSKLAGGADKVEHQPIMLGSLVLPSFYFFDHGEVIESGLEAMGGGRFRVHVDRNYASGGCGLNDFLVRMAMNREEAGDIWDQNFISSPLLVPISSIEIPHPIHLLKRVTMLELLKHFPASRTEIASIKVQGQQPVAASVSADLAWHNLESFQAFRQSVLGWLIEAPASGNG